MAVQMRPHTMLAGLLVSVATVYILLLGLEVINVTNAPVDEIATVEVVGTLAAIKADEEAATAAAKADEAPDEVPVEEGEEEGDADEETPGDGGSGSGAEEGDVELTDSDVDGDDEVIESDDEESESGNGSGSTAVTDVRIVRRSEELVPRFTYILPVYNGADYIESAVRSCLEQDYSGPFEVLVVDDGSTDNTLALVEAIDDERLSIVSQANARLPRALNTGLRFARGDYQTFVSSDNLSKPNFVSIMMGMADEYPEAAFYYADHSFIDAEGKTTKDKIGGTRVPLRKMLFRWDGLAAFAWSKAAAERVGEFTPSLEGLEDFEYWVRLTEVWPAAPWVDRVLIEYRRHEATMSHDLKDRYGPINMAMWDEMVRRLGSPLDVHLYFPSLRFCYDQERCGAHAWFTLGNVLQKTRFKDKAVMASHEYYERAVALAPEWTPARVNLARAQCVASQWDACGESLDALPGKSKHGTEVKKLVAAFEAQDAEKARAVKVVNPDLKKEELFRLEEEWVHMYSNVDWKSTKRPYKLVVIPSDPLQAYIDKGRSPEFLEEYYNPLGFFDEVYCLSHREKESYTAYGMDIRPVVEKDYSDFPGMIDAIEPHLIRAYGGYHACDVGATAVGQVPVVCSVHDTNPKLIYDSTREVDYLLAISSAVGKALVDKGADPRRILSFTNRVDMDVFKPVPADGGHVGMARATFESKYPGKYHIVHVGRKTKQKNWDTLIKAMKLLGEDYVTIFIGRGKEEPMAKLAREQGVADRCYFEQSVNNDLLPAYYSFSDAFCTPSRWEGFGIVFVEALSCEAVTVTSDIGPMNEFVHHEDNGLLVGDYENPKALADALRRAVTDAELRAKLKSRARSSMQKFAKHKVDAWEVELSRLMMTRSGVLP